MRPTTLRIHLVPKLRLGTHSREAPLRVARHKTSLDSKQSFESVGSQAELGNQKTELRPVVAMRRSITREFWCHSLKVNQAEQKETNIGEYTENAKEHADLRDPLFGDD